MRSHLLISCLPFIRSFLRVLFSLLLIAPTGALWAQWEKRDSGINGAEVRAFAVNDNYIFAGTYGAGVFRSADHGSTWQAINTGITNDNVISLITNGSYVFAGTDAGLFRSADNGNTWTQLTNLSTTARIYAVNLVNGYLFASGNFTGYVFRSTDNGETWQQANLGLPAGAVVYSFTVKGSVLYAALYSSGVYKSLDNGETWENSGLGGASITQVIVKGTDLFASGLLGIYRSTDDGANWVNIRGGGYPSLIATSAYLYACGEEVVRSADNGNTWATITTGIPTLSQYRTFITLASDNVNLYVSSLHYSSTNGSTQVGSVYRSSNNGDNWLVSNSGLRGVGIKCFISEGGYLFSGTSESGVYRSSDNGLNWVSVNTGLTNLRIQAFAKGNGYLFAGTLGGGVFRSANYGNTWEAVNTGLIYTDIQSLAISGSRLLAGSSGGGVYRSDNNGANWTASNAGIATPGYVYAFAVKDGYLFAANGATVYRSTNNGTSWPTSSTLESFSRVVTMVSANNNIYAATIASCCGGNTIQRSVDGVSWTGIGAGLGAVNVRGITSDNNVLYATNANETGVFASANEGTGWVPVGEKFLTNRTQVVHVHNGYLFAGTEAGGIYAIPLAQTVPNPVISSFSPTAGVPGTTIVITGSGFSTTNSVNEVSFNGVSGWVSAATATSLTVQVPPGATTGKVTVTVAGVPVVSTQDFTAYAAQPLSQPGFLSAVTASPSQINLSFPAASTITNGAGYIILRRQDGTNPTVTGIEDGTVPASLTLPAGTTLAANISTNSITSFENTGLLAATQYHYLIIPYNVQAGQAINYYTASSLQTANATTRAAEPTAQPTGLTFTNVLSSSMEGTFVAAAGSPAGYLVVRRAGAAPTGVPQDGTAYAAGATLGDGTVVSSGSGITFTSTGLAAQTVYHYAIYAYNGSGVTLNYREASPLQGSRSTVAAQPTTQASAIFFSAQTPIALTVSWSNGNGAERVVVARQGSAVSVNPAGGNTYTGNADFVLASDLGSGNKVVYRGTGNSVSVTNLSPGTEYHFRVYELNGTGVLTSYNTGTASGNPASVILLQHEPSAHPASFTATSVSNIQVGLSFSALSSIPNSLGYIILRRQDGSNPSITGITDGVAPASLSLPSGTTLITTITSLSQTTYTDGGLTTGTQYNYLIIPYNGNSTGTYNYKTDGTLRTAFATPTASGASDIVTASFSYPTNIAYQNYQAIDITSGTSVEAGRFTIRDGGGVNDADNSPTVLTAITFSIDNSSFIRSVALYDGATELAEATPVGGTVSFSGLNIIAPDNSTKNFSVRVSFNSTVTDNQQFSFTVTAATAQVGNSGFISANAGGAVTSTAGDDNRIEVTATKIVYVIQPPALTGVNTDVSPAPVLDAQDAFNNKDLDYSSAVMVSNSASLGMSNTPSVFSSGTLNFPNNFRFTTYGTTALTVSSGGLTNATSNSIVVQAAEPIAQPAALLFSTVSAISMNGSFMAASGSPSGYLVLRKAGSAPTEVPVDGTTYSGTFNTSTVVHNGSETSFGSTGLSAGTVYHYAVYAYNGSGQSINYLTANPLSGEKLTAPAAPVVDLKNPTSSSFVAEWSIVASATGYKLEVSLNSSFNPVAQTHDVTGTAFNVTGLQAATQYHVRVYAVNTSGQSESSAAKFITTQSFQGGSPLTIGTVNKDTQNNGTQLSVTLSGGEGQRTVKLFSRGIRGNTFSEAIINSTTSTYQITIPHADLDELGLEFYFEASDASGTATTVKNYIYKQIPANTTLSLPSGGEVKNYKIISIPYKLNNPSVSNAFPASWVGDKMKMRLVRISDNGKDYDPNDFKSSLSIGDSYWYNAREEYKIELGVNDGTVSQNNQSRPFELNLHFGWNMIATPFPFPISWDDVLEHNATTSVGQYHIFNGSGYTTSDNLEPWKGGFVHADNATTLNIPVVFNGSSGGRKSLPEEFPELPGQGNWLIPLALKQGNREQTLTAFGMHEEADESKDRFDAVALPRFIEHLDLNTTHDEYFSLKFMRDVVPHQNTYTWTFQLSSSSKEPVELRWDHHRIKSGIGQLLLYDKISEELIDMRAQGNYMVPASERELQFIYTREELLPGLSKVNLGVPYPNPFRSEVTLPSFINLTEDPVEVWVSIRSLTGIEIYRTATQNNQRGLIKPVWKGEDHFGQITADGVYIYQVTFKGKDRSAMSYGKVIKH